MTENGNNRKKLLIIDTFYLMHRSFHAYPTTLTTSKGEVTNMTFGFASSLVDLLATFNPDYLVCSWETIEQPSFRQGLYNSYQLNRMYGDPEEEQIFARQIPRIKDIINAFNIKIFQADGFEGDDVIGTLARNLEEKLDVVIYTADQDMLQLVDDHISVYRPAKPPFLPSKLFNPTEVISKYSFSPITMIDYKALRGDPSDNIPGVKGIGEVTAKKLLLEYQNLDNIYKNIDKITPASVKEKLIKDKDMAYLSKQLATIITNIPLEINMDDLEIKDFDLDNIKKICEKLEFTSVIKKLGKLEIIFKNKLKVDETKKSHIQKGLF